MRLHPYISMMLVAGVNLIRKQRSIRLKKKSVRTKKIFLSLNLVYMWFASRVES